MSEQKIIILHEKDNVAVALDELSKGSTISIASADGDSTVTLRDVIPFGHKFALQRIDSGANILKYGEVIGRATSPIETGEHVHIHNVESIRFSAKKDQ